MMPTEIKDSTRVEVFFKKNKKLESSDCDCKLCQDYLDSIGYVNLVHNEIICCL